MAAALLEAGHDVRIIDAYALSWSWKRFADELAAAHPDVLNVPCGEVCDVVWLTVSPDWYWHDSECSSFASTS